MSDIEIRGTDYVARVLRQPDVEMGLELGDFIVLREQTTAEPGQVVVAKVDDGWRLRPYREGVEFRSVVVGKFDGDPFAAPPAESGRA